MHADDCHCRVTIADLEDQNERLRATVAMLRFWVSPLPYCKDCEQCQGDDTALVVDEVYWAVRQEVCWALRQHPLFSSPGDAFEALQGEVEEVQAALAQSDMGGPHGYRVEMRHVAAVAIKALISCLLRGRETPEVEL